jgi:hypothetical protein
MNKLLWAENCNYWQTSQTIPDVWMERTCKLIRSLGGEVMGEGFGHEVSTNRSAYMLFFKIGADHFKITWPVLPTRNPKLERAARIQASTFLYHIIKAKVLESVILGARSAFFEFLMLPSGGTAAEATNENLIKSLDDLFGPKQPVLGSGDVEGEYKEIGGV